MRAFSIQLVFRVLGMAASFFTVALTTKTLGREAYGDLTTAVVFIGMWMSLTELGVGATIVRRAASGTGDLARLIRINCGLSIVYAVPLFVLAAVSGLLVYRDSSELRAMLLIVSGSLLLTSLSTCFEPVFLATVRFKAVAISDFASRLGSLAATAVLVAVHGELVWFAAVQLVPPAVQLVIQGVAASRILSVRPVFAMREAWDLLRESLPQTGVLIVAVLYWRVDGVVLSLRSTTDQVGVYGLAVSLAFTTSVVASFFLSSTLSSMTDLYARDSVAFGRFIKGSIETMLFVGAPIAVVGAALAHPMISLVGSAEFAHDGGRVLAFLFVAVAITFLNGALSQALFAAHEQVFLLRLNIVNLVANIVLNIFLTSALGALGAALALFVSELSGLVLVSIRLARRSSYRTPWMFAARLAVPVAASLGVVIALSHLSVVILGPIAAVVYLAVNALIGPITWSRIRAMRAQEEIESAINDESNPGRIHS
ncbi:oligosaccharide flippase family protein [Antrihabitans cavernicola]|uniref:Polysaccharide biosynthesis protein n=1 Tax=Antrihabitans cavernicola TaxID=2495913 RepID=A0A5A7SGT5_9NOCA|nr:oligosaccharide flippase family protein [Spelaeibacter cavernicola]KAA0023863.1 polysaccharide biosynthesis protein [Spelaeibacter cavernicola]